MAEIRILPEQVVNQIAAGEVVERAASVLKELIENALDAGASRIQVAVKGQGRELIQVVDDGCGMTRGDLHLAFERHATSKITRSEDLFSIRSLGFRGEALPSIASVSFVEARSCPDTAASGTMLRLEGGNIVHEEPVASARGTSVSVHSLFFNTPARARFLKSAATELAHLVRTFKQYALGYPEIAWSFANDDRLEYSLPAASLVVRLEDLFGAGITQKMLALDFDAGGIRVSGRIGTSELHKRSRGDQYIFLNRRPIQSGLVHSAVKAALRDQLEEGQWPFYVICLEVDPSTADVNVHPAKLEVRFNDERLVHGVIYRAVRTALPSQITDEPPVVAGARPGSAPRTERSVDAVLSFPLTAADASAPATARPEPGDVLLRPAILQAHGKYLISQISSGIAIVDQHAAHERILFEKARRSFDQQGFNSQQLLFPLLLELTPEEDAILHDLRDDLRKLGFLIRDFAVRAYSVEAVPAGLKHVSEVTMIHAMFEEYSEFRRAEFAPRDALAAGFACHAAIRSGDLLTPEEMTALVDELFATEFPLTCPHGRPTVIHLKLSELDRRFKRSE